MKSILITIIVLHGFIHILGFLKAFSFAEINQLTVPIDRFRGVLWLITSILFCIGSIFYGVTFNLWSIILIIATLLSQILVLYSWHDAKFATLFNLLILIISVIGYAESRFTVMVTEETVALSESLGNNITNEIVKEDDINELPQCVQKWLRASGMVNKHVIMSVSMEQETRMKMKPEQDGWYPATAHQFYTIKKPAFIWSVDMTMMSIIPFKGRDKFYEGKGEMLIKLASLFPIVNSANNPNINEGTMQRFLGEIVWFPSAAFEKYITWTEIDENSAKATMSYMGTQCSGIFTFDETGKLRSFTTQRYMGDEKVKREWTITADAHKSFHGITIPSSLHATWKLDTGNWTWLEMEIKDVRYNAPLIF